MSSKTNILVLAANPRDTPSLRLDNEVREIQAGLLRGQRDSFFLRQDWAVRPHDVRRSLLDHRPTIVHFCGHGSGEEGLVLEDETGRSRMVSTSAVAGLFALFSEQVECVILNACFSQEQAKAIARHVAYVVGMSREIGDRAATEFAIGFYDAVASGESYERAFRFGCNAIELAGLKGHDTPVLLLRNIDLEADRQSEPCLQNNSADTPRSATKALSIQNFQYLYARGWTSLSINTELIRLDYENIAGLDAPSEGVLERWAEIGENNPDSHAFLVDSEERIVGYWHFEALPGDLYDRALDGRLEDGEITLDKVQLLCVPGPVDIYFIVFLVERTSRGLRASRLLLEALLDRLEELASMGVYPRRVCANAFTPEGVALCRSLGMRYVRDHNRSGMIFEVQLSASAVLRRLRPRLAESVIAAAQTDWHPRDYVTEPRESKILT